MRDIAVPKFLEAADEKQNETLNDECQVKYVTVLKDSNASYLRKKLLPSGFFYAAYHFHLISLLIH